MSLRDIIRVITVECHCGEKFYREVRISKRKRKIKGKKQNPSFYIKCPSCGTNNHVKCRHKNGVKRKVTVVNN